jgi:tetratricopeptide (TPR) repeat protein
MNTKTIWISIIAVIISFIGGFILANAFNRSELDALRAENARLKNDPSGGAAQNQSETALGEEEIRRKIAEAEQNPTNFQFQKNLGMALYRYAAMKQDAQMLAEVEKILLRANQLNEKDYDVLVALGNVRFDIGYLKKQTEEFQKAREYYAKALEQNPKDVNVRTDLALTYFLQNPPDNEKAIAEFQKVLQENPKHERALQFITQTFLKTGNRKEAETYHSKLKEINPDTPGIEEFQAQMSQEANQAEK